jgi:hypothetical protein
VERRDHPACRSDQLGEERVDVLRWQEGRPGQGVGQRLPEGGGVTGVDQAGEHAGGEVDHDGVLFQLIDAHQGEVPRVTATQPQRPHLVEPPVWLPLGGGGAR